MQENKIEMFKKIYLMIMKKDNKFRGEKGMEIPVLSKILGHADISTTLNKYCHAIPDRKRENMDKIEFLYDDSLDGGI